MSFNTWKAEYYPVDAHDTHVDDALAHSIRKWDGFMPQALKKHDGHVDGYYGGYIRFADNVLIVDGSTCALCVHHLQHACRTCPLAQVRGGVPCDRTRSRELYSPYWDWVLNRKPNRMRQWLRRARKLHRQASR